MVGIASFAAFAFLSVPGLDPSQWSEVAVAARLRPPQFIFPGLWRAFACGLFSALGISHAIDALVWIGAALGGICIALSYLIVRQALDILTHIGEDHAAWPGAVCSFFALVAAVLVAVSDPVWRVVQTFSPEGLRLLMLLVSVHLYLRWLSCGNDWRLYPLVALVGILAAETPLAFALVLVLLASYNRLWRNVMNGSFMPPESLPNPEELPRWRMFFLFLGTLGATVWLNTCVFTELGGVEANGWSLSDVYFRYGAGYWRVLAGSSTMAGWALGLGFAIFPLVLALRLVPSAFHDDSPVSFHNGVILVFMGFLAIMQTGAFPSARFWLFTGSSVAVRSDFLLVFYILCSAFTISLVGAAFTVECQRSYLPEGAKRPGLLLRSLVPAIALAVVLLASSHISRKDECEASRIVRESLDETVRECADAKWLFTDGRLDDGLELAAAAMGRRLLALNMMSGEGRWEETIRTRGFPDGSVDRDNASIGIPMLLRVWAGEKPHGMDEAAMQLGLEFWKREGKEPPKASGFVARVTGLDDAEAARGVEAANVLAKRILALGETARLSPALADAISSVSWRISRFARLRNDSALADNLDRNNSALKHMLSIVEYERQRTFMQLTPREGLQLALKRADFVEARRYAATVLRNDEEDPEANFGMGMSHLRDGRMEEAEFYLRRCLIRRPHEPAVLNNLSIICRKAGRFEEAEEFARHALKMLPDSPEVRQTLQSALDKTP
jgi:tetratricopeptide (TPR) repeat protein